MVMGTLAREDVEFLLTKSIVYKRQTDEIVDFSTNEIERDFEKINIKAQVTLQSFSKEPNSIGTILQGDLVGFLRYEYCFDENGRVLNPKLIPKRNDEIIFLGRTFVLKDVTPATSEDEIVIGWDIRCKEN